MLLTLFYMVSTWVQSWRLSSLKARLIGAINYGPDFRKPSIMFYTKPSEFLKDDTVVNIQTNNENGTSENLLTSSLCSNKNSAKLKDLIWSQGDKRLCTIYPQQQVDISEWLSYPIGKTFFPLCLDNCNQINVSESSTIHVLIEADIENFTPSAFAKAMKLEDYGFILSWMADKYFAAIMKTDVDHLSKLSIALMQGQCFINNGLILTRIESVEIIGKPCKYIFNDPSVLPGKKLIGKSQWEAHLQTLKTFSNFAKNAFQEEKPVEIDNLPGVIIISDKLTVDSPMFEMSCATDKDDDKQIEDHFPVPSTPPPTPASIELKDKSTPELIQHLGSSVLKSTTFNDELNTSATESINNSITAPPPIDSVSIITSANNEIVSKNFKINSKNVITNRASKFSSEKKQTSNYEEITKPPNILIYADSTVASDNIQRVLKQTLNKEKYIIYTLTPEDARRDVWKDQTHLIVVCGNVDNEVATQLIDYLVAGGKLLALCSDTLHTILPSFKTAEVREHELVRFSYGRWKNVRMMHHIFCYQASPVKSRFSQDNEDGKIVTRPTPVSANVKDKQGKNHTFQIKVLGAEETWNTPSIVLADLPSSSGKAIFSQIHLEADPSQYELEEAKFNALKESNSARLEILSDLLGTHLKLDVKPEPLMETVYTPGFFLGRHELKLNMLDRLKSKMKSNNIFKTSKIELQFCNNDTKLMKASKSLLPILLYQCPENFSTVEYFENLQTKEIGRLVVYTDIITSTMDVVAGCELYHGLVVISRQQTSASGRNKNVWLSPKGCVTFSLQIHIPLNTYIGQHLSIIQHIAATSIVLAIRGIPGYEDIDLNIKWPNDIYVGNEIKIGGLIVTSLMESQKAICNIGIGINLSNSIPTSCINDIIIKHNEKNGTKLETIGYEKYLALLFNAFESIFIAMQNEDLSYFYQFYYNYWLHTDTEVSVTLTDGITKEAKILGINSLGFLEVQEKDGNILTVQPDGNSFDILKGLIVPSLTR
ncbi:biotin--protein ligase [Chelonus insularis]|uniref:biotin--protein ligase n=1 Tax=Chelonus insularis TaxID=460826 RepID=UPI00158F07C2|nr:biotin--protein ligase [Chelonus insularis]XP_034936139.1 biotin--protein ligase [Chelonus insularis]